MLFQLKVIMSYRKKFNGEYKASSVGAVRLLLSILFEMMPN